MSHTADRRCRHKVSESKADKTAATKTESSCCSAPKKKLDMLFWLPLVLVLGFYALHVVSLQFASVDVWAIVGTIGHSIYELINTMALGMVIGMLMVAILHYVPRELVVAALGRGGGMTGLVRATAAGVLLDLCSHGILMVGSKLYERGASTGQVMAFLIASPWNSLSLTVILVALIGLSWTLLFILLSAIVAVITGAIFDCLVAKGLLAANPYQVEMPEGYRFWQNLRQALRKTRFTLPAVRGFVTTGCRESKVVIRWLLIGVILASLIRAFVSDEYFTTYFGPTILGLSFTMLVATVMEVCSEGATPIAADIFNRAGSPGNSFAFLMAGVSTDYTEIMVLKEVTRSWRIALFLPLITLPQIVFIALLINKAT